MNSGLARQLRTRTRQVRGAARSRRDKRDVDTRQQLLEAALQLFAARGFHAVTVREISRRAGANLAAISYHFGDKLGLYAEILERTIAAMRALHETSVAAAAHLPAEDKLREFVRTYLPRAARPDERGALMQQLMRHEMHTPTRLLERVFERGIAPRMRYLQAIIAELLACSPDEERVQLCALSIQGQCLFFMRDKLRANLPKLWSPRSDADLARATEHVAEFAVAGVRAFAKAPRSARE